MNEKRRYYIFWNCPGGTRLRTFKASEIWKVKEFILDIENTEGLSVYCLVYGYYVPYSVVDVAKDVRFD